MQDPRIRVSFYVLDAVDPDARLVFACRLAEKAWRQQHRVHAHAGSTAEAERLDERLWTFRDGSFVPHEMLGDGLPESPVTIGSGESPAPPADLLLNLADEVPACWEAFGRIAEIVDGTESGREAGRRRHRFYRSRGLEPETHRIS